MDYFILEYVKFLNTTLGEIERKGRFPNNSLQSIRVGKVPSFIRAKEIADVLGVPVDAFFIPPEKYFATHKPSPDADKEELLRLRAIVKAMMQLLDKKEI